MMIPAPSAFGCQGVFTAYCAHHCGVNDDRSLYINLESSNANLDMKETRSR